jgi:RNA polymerase sigma-70 factor (ECF subfamily)
MDADLQVQRVPMSKDAVSSRRDRSYTEVAATYGGALERLARAYEADAGRRVDLVQEIHVALWRSLETFDARCSLRTWVYRVAHNVATSHVIRARKSRAFVSLEELEHVAGSDDTERATDKRKAMEKLLALIQDLNPVDRQVILLYLEGMDAAAIGDITGLTSSNVATKVHRIKTVLTHRFHGEAP